MLLFPAGCPSGWASLDAAHGHYLRVSDGSHLAAGTTGGHSEFAIQTINLPPITATFYYRTGMGTFDTPRQAQQGVRNVGVVDDPRDLISNPVNMPVGGQSQPIELDPQFYSVALCQRQ